MAHGETPAHAQLKRLALAWASSRALPLQAYEVRVPRSGFRADAVAAEVSNEGRVVVFECKQSRTDFLKDAHEEVAVRLRLRELSERQRALDDLLAMHRPELRRGEALWPEFDSCDFSTVEHRTRRRLQRELQSLTRHVREGTKFSRMARYRCADELYLVLEPDIFAPGELPQGWGVLVREGSALKVLRVAPQLAPDARQQLALRRSLRRACGESIFVTETDGLQLELSA